jgi:dTDP-4-amino-4,6-dideoxygalactose transaminase
MPAWTIPILDMAAEISALRSELMDAIAGVVDSGSFILGPQVSSFEDEVASHIGVRRAVGVNSGTDALVIGLKALGIREGDEVITTPFTFFATAEAISNVGAKPVFVDIDPRTFNIDSEKAEAAVTDRTRAVLPVHLFGQAAAIDELLKWARVRGLRVLEDAAQAFGATRDGRSVGSYGDASSFSFFPSKNLGGFGDGGLIATDDEETAELALRLRSHGSLRKYRNEMLGYNSRLDELQAAILRVKLTHVAEANKLRHQAADRYTETLDSIEEIVPPYVDSRGGHVFHQYTIRVLNGKRDAVAERLAGAGIQTMVYYPVPVHRLPVYLGVGCPSLPVAEQAAQEVLSLPIGPTLSWSAQEQVVSELVAAVRKP